ncbi:MAG: sugar phosphate isomerase/epimerase family protein [Lentisphaeria bacterium]
MKTIDVTHNFNFAGLDGKLRRFALEELAAAGIKHLVFSTSLIHAAMADANFEQEISLDLQAFGLSFLDSHLPFGIHEVMNLPLEEEREIMLLRNELGMQLAAAAGAKVCAFHTGNNNFPEYTLPIYHEQLLRSLERLLPMAEKLHLVLALENQWTPPNATSKMLAAVKHFDSPFLGICYDAGHANLMAKGKDQLERSCVPGWWKNMEIEWDEQLLERVLPYVVTCHLHDNDGITDQHLLPGKGNIDWPKIMALLRQAPRLQCIQNEMSLPSEGVSLKQVAQTYTSLIT